MDKFLEALSTPNGIWLFLWVVAPGFFSMKVVELKGAGGKLKVPDAIVEIVCFSILDNLVLTPIYALLNHFVPTTATWLSWLFLVPISILIGWGYIELRKGVVGPGILPHPSPKAWDWLFSDRLKEERAIVVVLNDDSKVGGLWNSSCFASSYPEDDQIYIAEPCHINENGRVGHRIDGQEGVLISKDAIKLIEIYSIQAH